MFDIGILISLIIWVVIVGIVFYIAKLLLDLIPMDAAFKNIAQVLLILVAVLIVISHFLPLLGHI